MTTTIETTEKTQRASRRGKGEGSIRQRSDGTWEARIDIGRDANGRRKTKSVYGKTKKEVGNELTKLASQKIDGTLIAETKLTVGEFLDKWLADAVKLSNRAATHSSYSQNVKVHIKPAIGAVKLSKLTPMHVQGMYAAMERGKKSARMRQMQHAILRRALSVACKWGLIARNVCDAVDRPTVPKHEITPLNAAQVSKLMKAAESDRIHALIVLAVFSGLRQGELFGLEWNDVDMKSANLMVRRTVVDLGGTVTTSPPKTGKGQRLVELPQMAIDALWKHKAKLMTEGLAKSPLVFPGEDGGYQRRFGPFREEFKAVLKRAGLPAIRFHDLRHSAATLLLGEGVHPKIVQERLGHSTIAITMDTYSHILPSMQKDAVGKLDLLFKTKGRLKNSG